MCMVVLLCGCMWYIVVCGRGSCIYMYVVTGGGCGYVDVPGFLPLSES